ncbi:hypothetical protein MCOR02_007176 [Pyricularia oryzae]|nr:hypothetical protein MCOR02_007176 [Pyricularia oryzae]KAI6464162.1 hypothetical protein MCOR17_005426 [Pyricularia oryzae]KAI6578994.1 hypothetical protein MCOR04_006230 [Pyricularia oryzae]
MAAPASDVDAVYIAAGANRHSAVADWGWDGTVAYGADANIALWRPMDDRPGGVTRLLSGHKGVVKAVKFLPALSQGGDDDKPSSSYLVSGSDDQSLMLWELKADGSASVKQTVNEHTAPVHCIAVLASSAEKSSEGRATTILASGGADATIRIWRCFGPDGELSLLQTIATKPKYFPLALSLSCLSQQGNAFILASAGTRDTVQIFSGSVAGDDSAADFQLAATLSGHEGWIRSLDFAWENADSPGQGDLLLASASQDKYIRLWRVHKGKELPAKAAAPSDGTAVAGSFLPGKSPSNKAHRLTAGGEDYSVSFEALLLGHDDWIYSAKWGRGSNKTLQLLSTSADNTLAIWEADPESGIWITSARLGELSKEKGATTATGSIGGFWTGLWSPSAETVVCLGRTGSWRRWDFEDDGAGGVWNQALAVSGHTRAVTGITWSRDGSYLLSTSLDQTTRLHAEWRTRSSAGDDSRPTWHEMARPQIHGYDLNCIDTITSSQFVSGADEKLMRVFSAPKTVARMLERLSGKNIIGSGPGETQALPDAANIPVLGLSNKAVDAVDDQTADQAEAEAEAAEVEAAMSGNKPADNENATVYRASALDFDRPPYEDSLSRHTLWPEIEKLYGHGYELSCLATSHDGKVVASACKASSINHAVVRLFHTGPRWTEIKPPLTAHSLTATRLRFSHDDKYLLSVGRDRQWAVFQRSDGEEPGYSLLQAEPKGHTRMILDAAWAPLTASLAPVFATAGRDKAVKLWSLSSDDKPAFKLALMLPQRASVTSVDFLQRSAKDQEASIVLAVGTEGGDITIYAIDSKTWSLISEQVLEQHLCSSKSILQLTWRPVGSSQDADAQLAIACEDSSLRIIEMSSL